MDHQLTIIVPTRNRPEFLRRLLYFFSEMQVKSKIVVVDSSGNNVLTENGQTILSSPLKDMIVHKHDPSNMITKCRLAMEQVTTPYSVFCADDDFVLSDSVQQCIEFLEDNDDYASATGTWISMNPEKKNGCHMTRGFSITDDDPFARFHRLASCWFATFYCVYRTEPLRKSWQVTDDATDYLQARVFPETMLAQLSVVYGKLAVLPKLHILFELHGMNEHYKLPLVADPTAYVHLYRRFETALSVELCETAGVPYEEARRAVHQQYGFWEHNYIAGVGKFTGWKRFKKNLNNQVSVTRDRIFGKPSDIWLRRRLRDHDAVAQSECWQLARDLAVAYPRGMERRDLSFRSNAA